MNESIGSYLVIVITMVFIIAISSYIAFTINYSKAFKVKSKVIDTIQRYDNDPQLLLVRNEIQKYVNEIGYSVDVDMIRAHCTDGYNVWADANNQGWCYKIISDEVNSSDGTTRTYVKVKTFVSIDIPIIKQIMRGSRLFVVEGSTKPTYR